MFTPEQLMTVAGLAIVVEVVLYLFRVKSLSEKLVKDLVFRGIIHNAVIFVLALLLYWLGLWVPFFSLAPYAQAMILTALAATLVAIGGYETVNNIVRGVRGNPT